MMLKEIIQHYIYQLTQAINQLSDNEFIAAIEPLGNATIGQHIRHIVELFEELQNGYNTGTVCYDNRKRDFAIETDRLLAIKRLQHIGMAHSIPDKKLLIKCSYATQGGDELLVESNYLRELIYNIEHTVHHMALLRVAFNQISALELPKDFGVAVSTIRHKNLCAQ